MERWKSKHTFPQHSLKLTDRAVLILSCNEITRITGLDSLRELEHLELSFNRISDAKGLFALRRLTTLNLSHNVLGRLDDLTELRKHSGTLIELDTRGNPLARDRSYRQTVLRTLPELTRLDGEDCTGTSKIGAYSAT